MRDVYALPCPTGSGLYYLIIYTSTGLPHISPSSPPSARALGRQSTGEDRYSQGGGGR